MDEKLIPVSEYHGRWCFRSHFYEKGQRHQVRRMFATKAEAVQGYIDFVKQAQTEPMTADKYTVDEWIEVWLGILEDGSKSPVTIEGNANVCRLYLSPYIGGIRIASLTEEDVRSAYRALAAKGLADSTIEAARRCLKAALNQAVRERKIPRNVAQWVEKPKGQAARDHIVLTVEEIAKFRQVLDADRMSALWVLAMTTGMRRGELAGLQWSQFDAESGILTVDRQRTATPSGRVVNRATAKTAAGNRRIPLSAGAVDSLRNWRRRQAEERLRLGARWRGGDYVFTSTDGSPYHPQSLTTRLKYLAEKAGVPVLPLHHLRHTFATHGMRAGVDTKKLSAVLGHSRVQTTQNLYQHVDDDDARSVVDDITARLFG